MSVYSMDKNYQMSVNSVRTFRLEVVYCYFIIICLDLANRWDYVVTTWNRLENNFFGAIVFK